MIRALSYLVIGICFCVGVNAFFCPWKYDDNACATGQEAKNKTAAVTVKFEFEIK